MRERILAVDADLNRYNAQCQAWARHGIELVRTPNMPEAIDRAGRESFLAIGVNADSIQYEPYLAILRTVTDASIHIVASSFDKDASIQSFRLGANVYALWGGDAEEHVCRILAQTYRHFDTIGLKPYKASVFGIEDIRIYPESSIVTYLGKELMLMPKEYQILMFLMENHERIMTYEQIFSHVWGMGYDDAEHSLLWRHMHNLRRRIHSVSSEREYVVSKRNLGYIFTTKT